MMSSLLQRRRAHTLVCLLSPQERERVVAESDEVDKLLDQTMGQHHTSGKGVVERHASTNLLSACLWLTRVPCLSHVD